MVTVDPRSQNVKAILFDSGRTLNVPSTGHWFITPNFDTILVGSGAAADRVRLCAAMDRACDYLNGIATVSTEAEEFLMFKEFYRRVLDDIGYPCADDRIAGALAQDNVYNDEKFHFFPDVEATLAELHDDYVLGVVSDTWPSLERVFINRGLRQYFSTFVMSSVHGSSKADGLLFGIALDEIGLRADETVFVDDSESNLQAADRFGMIPVLMDRYSRMDLRSEYPIVRSIAELPLSGLASANPR